MDDLALLVDLVSSGWRVIDTRLARLEGRTTHDADESSFNGYNRTSHDVDALVGHAAAA